LVKPALAQWYLDPSQGSGWQLTNSNSNYWGAFLNYPTGTRLDYGTFYPATGWSPGGYLGLVRIPMKGTLWMGVMPTLDENGNPLYYGPYATLPIDSPQGGTLSQAFLEPIRNWMDVPLVVQDGNGKPYPTGLLVRPAHGGADWCYSNSGIVYDPTTPYPFTLTLPQGDEVTVQTMPPLWWLSNGTCGPWWSGFLTFVVPNDVPTDPLVLSANTDKSVVCSN